MKIEGGGKKVNRIMVEIHIVCFVVYEKGDLEQYCTSSS